MRGQRPFQNFQTLCRQAGLAATHQRYQIYQAVLSVLSLGPGGGVRIRSPNPPERLPGDGLQECRHLRPSPDVARHQPQLRQPPYRINDYSARSFCVQGMPPTCRQAQLSNITWLNSSGFVGPASNGASPSRKNQPPVPKAQSSPGAMGGGGTSKPGGGANRVDRRV
jgi:hypothetical protein